MPRSLPELLVEFRERYIVPLEGIEEPDELLIELDDAILNLQTAGGDAAFQLETSAEVIEDDDEAHDMRAAAEKLRAALGDA